MSEEQEDKDGVKSITIPDEVAKLVDSVPVRRYMELYRESKNTIDMRIKRGYWRKGIEYGVPKGGGLWISLKAVNEWAKS